MTEGDMTERFRLVKPKFNLRARFPALDFSDRGTFQTGGEAVLVTDPIYLTDVYNSQEGTASFVRQHGVIVWDFGGDTSGPVWWQPPSLKIAFALDSGEPPPSATVMADEVGCDSGSLVFLPLTKALPPGLRAQVDRVLVANSGVALTLPAGTWTVWYEQHDSEEWNAEFFRDIVALWEPDESLQPRLEI